MTILFAEGINGVDSTCDFDKVLTKEQRITKRQGYRVLNIKRFDYPVVFIVQQAIGPHEDLTIVKRRKLQWYGHVSRSSGLAKTISQGTMKEGR